MDRAHYCSHRSTCHMWDVGGCLAVAWLRVQKRSTTLNRGSAPHHRRGTTASPPAASESSCIIVGRSRRTAHAPTDEGTRTDDTLQRTHQNRSARYQHWLHQQPQSTAAGREEAALTRIIIKKVKRAFRKVGDILSNNM